ncbi:MAG: hypothetical protein WC328_06365 [Kiritimatiellia bacterium]|jgi:hypothetical protein|nr:hypothetical protein [Kiritimatiellia bacterium]MDX9791945.1 hypothetical protein [Kiritimatiellia bacterium]NLC82433.1 hypothetical protein [Lentisphaerota bacterium]
MAMTFLHLNAAKWRVTLLVCLVSSTLQAADTWDGEGDDALCSTAAKWARYDFGTLMLLN